MIKNLIGILIIITGIITTVIIVNKNSKPKEISDEQWVINQRTHINNLVNSNITDKNKETEKTR